MRLSSKDFILLIGILVAVVIALTTWMYSDFQPKASIVLPPAKKKTLNSTTSMIINKLTKKAQLTVNCIR